MENLELYKYEILKNVIKSNIEIDKKGIITADYRLGEEIVKVIKYADTKFYNELQQRAEQ